MLWYVEHMPQGKVSTQRGQLLRTMNRKSNRKLAYHANIISIQEDFWKFGLSTCIVAIKLR